MRGLLRAGTLVVSGVLALAVAEVTARAADGWPLWGRLALAEHAVDEATTHEDERPDRRHVHDIPLASGVSPEWYDVAKAFFG